MSTLNVPNLHDSLAASFSILKLQNLPRALVSFFVVVAVIVKGLYVLDVDDCCGYLFNPIVTFAFPCNVLKSGTNLRNAINTSPATFGPVACPF